LDIGTGSGAIALALVQEGIAGRAIGVDVSTQALEQAAENRRLAGLEDRVELRSVVESPWEAVREEDRFDLIVSNPPYVAESEIGDLAPEVRDHEPRAALAGGDDGLDVVREIARRARRHLSPGGALFLEVGSGQAGSVEGILRKRGPWESVEAYRDHAGTLRFVVARA
jgi:release factor glutamine methyltransferase